MASPPVAVPKQKLVPPAPQGTSVIKGQPMTASTAAAAATPNKLIPPRNNPLLSLARGDTSINVVNNRAKPVAKGMLPIATPASLRNPMLTSPSPAPTVATYTGSAPSYTAPASTFAPIYPPGPGTHDVPFSAAAGGYQSDADFDTQLALALAASTLDRNDANDDQDIQDAIARSLLVDTQVKADVAELNAEYGYAEPTRDQVIEEQDRAYNEALKIDAAREAARAAQAKLDMAAREAQFIDLADQDEAARQAALEQEELLQEVRALAPPVYELPTTRDTIRIKLITPRTPQGKLYTLNKDEPYRTLVAQARYDGQFVGDIEMSNPANKLQNTVICELEDALSVCGITNMSTIRANGESVE